eukprot:scaffold9663_cov81-Isochrysis_galbana.AAC.1
MARPPLAPIRLPRRRRVWSREAGVRTASPMTTAPASPSSQAEASSSVRAGSRAKADRRASPCSARQYDRSRCVSVAPAAVARSSMAVMCRASGLEKQRATHSSDRELATATATLMVYPATSSTKSRATSAPPPTLPPATPLAPPPPGPSAAAAAPASAAPNSARSRSLLAPTIRRRMSPPCSSTVTAATGRLAPCNLGRPPERCWS